MKKKPADIGVESFRNGLNCAQSVLTTYASELNIDNKLAKDIASGFGGGMGKLQLTCGAVTGSFMVISQYNSKIYMDYKESKEKTNLMIQEFSEKFKSIHGTMDCSSLLNCDLKTEEGQNYARENNLYEKVCEKCVSDSIGIMEDLIRE